jgi:hypothetical protein
MARMTRMTMHGPGGFAATVRQAGIDKDHLDRLKLSGEHKHGEHERLFVDECPECQADRDLLIRRGR